MFPNGAVGAPLVGENRLVGNVTPPSVERKIPAPDTAAWTVEDDAVSGRTSVTRPLRTGWPLLKVGAFEPKLRPASTERKRPTFVATSSTFGAGSTMRLMQRLLTMPRGLRTIQASSASTDLEMPPPWK